MIEYAHNKLLEKIVLQIYSASSFDFIPNGILELEQTMSKFFYFQTLNTISAEKNSTIVFPLPIDIITYFMKAYEHRNK